MIHVCVPLLFSDFFFSLCLSSSLSSTCYCRVQFRIVGCVFVGCYLFCLFGFVYIVISYVGWLAFFWRWYTVNFVSIALFPFQFDTLTTKTRKSLSICSWLKCDSNMNSNGNVQSIWLCIHAVQMPLFFIQWEFKIKSNTAPKCYRWYLGSHVTKFQKYWLKYELCVANVKKWANRRERESACMYARLDVCVCVCGKRTCGSNLNT